MLVCVLFLVAGEVVGGCDGGVACRGAEVEEAVGREKTRPFCVGGGPCDPIGGLGRRRGEEEVFESVQIRRL